MPFSLPPLLFSETELAPRISSETLHYHYGKHHRAYVEKTNQLLESSELRYCTLEEIIRESQGTLFNHSAQAWNHTFFWRCLSSHATHPSQEVSRAIDQTFGDRETFLEEFLASARNQFGSGWTWLLKNTSGEISIMNTSNADTPLRLGQVPLLVVDVWEHAYYIDYRNDRAAYLEAFRTLLNWRFISERFADPDIYLATNEMWLPKSA